MLLLSIQTKDTNVFWLNTVSVPPVSTRLESYTHITTSFANQFAYHEWGIFVIWEQSFDDSLDHLQIVDINAAIFIR